MKIAISAQGTDLASEVDPRFGRAKYFIVVDTETNEFNVHDNAQNVNALQGAGIQAAKNVADTGAQAVVSGNVGPKAFATLNAAGIDMYVGMSGTVQDAVNAFKAGTLQKTQSANVGARWK